MGTHAYPVKVSKKERPESSAAKDRSANARDDQAWAASRFESHYRQGFSQMSPRDVVGLQGLVGNRAVSSLAADHDRAAHRVDRSVHGSSARATKHDRATHGRATSSFTVTATFAGRAPTPSVKHGLGDVRDGDFADDKTPKPVVTSKKPGEIEIEESDAVVPALTYGSQVGTKSDAPGPHEFGVTTTSISVNDVDVQRVTPQAPAARTGLGSRVKGFFKSLRGAKGNTPAAPASAPAPAHFQATANVQVSSMYSVHSLGRTDISSGSSPEVTADNYEKIAADLTPNMSSDGGRPRRKSYWAKDLTLLHERFHATERTGRYGQAAFDVAKNWLQAQTATDEDEVEAALSKIPEKMSESYAASFTPGKETRAYGDGAPLYSARAEAVRARGRKLAGTPSGAGPVGAVPASAMPTGGGSGSGGSGGKS